MDNQNMMLSSLFAKVLKLSSAMNPVVDVSTLEGRSFGLDITELPSKISLKVEGGDFIACDYEMVDVMISGSASAFIGMIRDMEDGLDRDDLFITGKLSSAKRFQEFMSGMRLDWDKVMKKFASGDLFEQVGSNASGFVDIATDIFNASTKTVQKTVEEGIKTFVDNPNSPFVTRTEFEGFTKQLQEVHERIDAIFSRLANGDNKKDN